MGPDCPPRRRCPQAREAGLDGGCRATLRRLPRARLRADNPPHPIAPAAMKPDTLTFARTKIQPPRLRAGLLVREGPVALIAQGLQQARLTLVCAPGGFGKSSAVVQALQGSDGGLRFAWIACDEGDTLARLSSAIVAALEPFDVPWRLSPEALIAALDRPEGQRAFRDALVNALLGAEGPRAVIVFDDLHRLADARALEFLGTLPPLLPEHWGMAVVTRVDPPWPLPRWRAAGDLVELRQDELRFTRHEIEMLATAAGHDAAEAAALLARTEGWPVGVTLALAGAPNASPVRSARHAVDYLRAEVLDHLPPALRGFLVQSSVLPELTAARAAAVSGRADAAACLDDIERRGLFYQELDSAERTLRLHDLFRDALEAERQRLPPDEQAALWRRAADSEPDPTRRFAYQLQAGVHGAAVQTLTEAAPGLIAAGMGDAVRDMLGRLPPELQAHAPEIALLRGVMAWEGMDLHAMLEHMKHAAREFAVRGDAEGHDLARAYVALAINGLSPIGRPETDPAYEVSVHAGTPPRTRVIAALQRAWHAFDLADFEGTNRHYGEVLDQLARDPDAALWYQVTPGIAYYGVRALQPLLERYAMGALRVAGEDYPVLRAIALAVRSCATLWRGAVDEARAQADEAVSLCAWLNYPQTASLYALIGRLLCRTVQGEAGPAVAEYRAAIASVEGLFGDDGRGPGWYLHWFELRCCLMADRHDLARDALAALRRTMPASVQATHTGPATIIDAYEAWLAGDGVRARAHLRGALGLFGGHDAVGIVTALQLQLAALALEQGDEAEAATALRAALDGIRERGYLMSARFAGAMLLRLLADSDIALGLDTAQAATLSAVMALVGRPTVDVVAPPAALPAVAPAGIDEPAAAAGPAAAGATVSIPAIEGALEPLSHREMEVLAHIAAGDSNKLIARYLDLSPHTVKRHVANILGKLGVASRGQAAARYRSLASGG
jgi:LuxR family maltose regulon positive regulatory protein